MRIVLKNSKLHTNEWIKFEWPFWLVFTFWSIVPDLKTPKFEILAVPVNSKDIAVILLAYLYLFWPKIHHYAHPIATRPAHWHQNLPVLTAALMLYAAVSVERSGMNELNKTAMLYTLAVTVATALLGYLLIAKMPAEFVLPFLWRLTIVLAVLGLLYSFASFFSFGFGDVRQSLNSQDQEFGIVRVAGPLFIAAKGFFILVPALALSIQECIRSQNKILFKIIIVFILTFTIFGLGSRAGLVISGIFLFAVILFAKNKKQALMSTFIIAILTVTSLFLIFSKANPERLKTMEDATRQGTYETSLQIIANRNANLNIFGSGYGSYWPWYMTDVTQSYHQKGVGIALVYPFGYVLYHPHSTIVLLIVELGLFGLIYFIYLYFVLLKIILYSPKNIDFSIFKSGIFASGFSMFFDLFLFKEAPTNLLWWIFLFGALSLNSENSFSRLNSDRINKNY